jgi:hypothetical protein
MYVIFGGVDEFDDQPLFWNNDSGWGSLESATQFSEEEKQSSNLPVRDSISESVWVKLPERTA